MAKPNDKSAGVDPVAFTLGAILVMVALAAIQVWLTAGTVIDAAQDHHTYAVFVTDEGIKSDNKRLEAQVNEGVWALMGARQMAMALIAACVGLGAALGWRCWHGIGQGDTTTLKGQKRLINHNPRKRG